MTRIAQRLVWTLVALLAVAGAFAAGTWWGHLRSSLQQESRYPWNLHGKIAQADLRCERFSRDAGAFMIQTIDGGRTLVVGVLNRASGEASVHAIDDTGRFATDTVPVDCRKQPAKAPAASSR